ncbi:MAG: hypothetical protein FWE24_07705 [Defluviitaleaceae bacterium]|nr:hypothetical protein [Defluviitaleaceae bacterium]
MARKRLTRAERDAKESMEYQRKLENTVDSIIAVGKREGKIYTKYDRMCLLAFHDERDISDFDLRAELDKIKELEKRESEAKENS